MRITIRRHTIRRRVHAILAAMMVIDGATSLAVGIGLVDAITSAFEVVEETSVDVVATTIVTGFVFVVGFAAVCSFVVVVANVDVVVVGDTSVAVVDVSDMSLAVVMGTSVDVVKIGPSVQSEFAAIPKNSISPRYTLAEPGNNRNCTTISGSGILAGRLMHSLTGYSQEKVSMLTLPILELSIGRKSRIVWTSALNS